jgi:1-pyrroline-5-carboxylate dehydrogenase
LREAGLPDGALNYVSGPGGSVGNRLVEHPQTRFIAFTGSKEVGLDINQRAARHQPGQIWVKRVVAEMGGKDSIIVDEEADLDAAVAGVVASAFGYQGQKCSACSRAIVAAPLYDEFVRQVRPRSTHQDGRSGQAGTDMGPIVSAGAERSWVHRRRKEGGTAPRGRRRPKRPATSFRRPCSPM